MLVAACDGELALVLAGFSCQPARSRTVSFEGVSRILLHTKPVAAILEGCLGRHRCPVPPARVDAKAASTCLSSSGRDPPKGGKHLQHIKLMEPTGQQLRPCHVVKGNSNNAGLEVLTGRPMHPHAGWRDGFLCIARCRKRKKFRPRCSQ